MTHKEKILKYYNLKKWLAKECLFALQALLVQYEENETKLKCSLCSIDEAVCSDCPWYVLLGRPCISKEQVMQKGKIACYNRKKQIERWIKAYEEALKEM